MKWIYAAGLALGMVAGQASAGFNSGADVYSGLQAFDANQMDPRGIMAVGYVMGVADGLENDGTLCYPSKVTVGQVVQVAKNYLSLHPEGWNNLASDAIEASFLAPWRCKQ